MIQVDGVGKTFKAGLLRTHATTAVRDVSLRIAPGKTLAVVGESGCGKTTLARLAAGLLRPDAGAVMFAGQTITAWPRKQLRRRLQMIFQDADGSLNPNLTAEELLLEPMRLHGSSRVQSRERLPEMLDMVGLTPDLLPRHPHEMSGGQRQRIGLARAMSLEPELVIADEPVASLDRSVQAQILSQLNEFQKRDGVAYLYISHDLATVRALADEVAVMLGGVFVETGPAEDVFRNPAHPYTRLLLDAVDEGIHAGARASGLENQGAADQTPANQAAVNRGCPLAPVCPLACASCTHALPSLVGFEPNRAVRCERVC